MLINDGIIMLINDGRIMLINDGIIMLIKAPADSNTGREITFEQQFKITSNLVKVSTIS